MGVSEHIQDNMRVFTFHLTEEDNAKIEEILRQSREAKLMENIGDCGSEYRR
jgi:diketogulonate reductase-like aldo/keto reductase